MFLIPTIKVILVWHHDYIIRLLKKSIDCKQAMEQPIQCSLRDRIRIE